MKICKAYNVEKTRERDAMTTFFILIAFVLPIAIAIYYLIP